MYLPTAVDTDKLGSALAPLLRRGMVIYLQGELGAGKSALVRAVLRTLGVTGHIKSPTYALVELYVVSSLNLYHFDFYRFNNPEEWEEAGFRDYFNNDTVCLVEWPEKALGLLPEPDMTIGLSMAGEGRQVEIMLSANVEQKCTTARSSILDFVSGLAT